ncbi:histidine kinase [Streptomyces sp. ODS28]|uniref:sensor histidine kinase n=1 Tax=Streptomyces sp. ODS28 TaxID=3136688 RepID=UPI0031F0F62D
MTNSSVTNGSAASRPAAAREWLRAHPYLVDVLIALGALAAVLVGASTEPHGAHGGPAVGQRPLTPHTVVPALLACGALVLRRRAALPVLCFTVLVCVVSLVLDPRSGVQADRRAPVVAAAVIALYTVTNSTDRLTSWRVGAATVAVLTAAGMLFGSGPWYAQENLGIFAWTGLAAAAGEAVRSRRAFIDAMRERAERAERTREEEAGRRVAEERMRIARELHDVVAHHIALVNVQAGVASHVMDQRPDQARQALAHVREASRHALDELQTTVGLLRQSGESSAPTEPAPGLGVLDELVDGFVRAGLTVTVERDGRPGDGQSGDGQPAAGGAQLPSAVDLTAYRVVQEALTNVQKHVGTGARAEVRIARQAADPAAGGEVLEVTVTDDGAGVAAPADAGPGEGRGGHGLLGMRERAAALGGRCETGPVAGGGFRVQVRLPLQPPRTAPPAGADETETKEPAQ